MLTRLKIASFVALYVVFVSSATSQINKTSSPLLAELRVPDRVQSLAFSPDGKLLAAGYGWSGGGIRIWSVADRTVITDLAVGKDESDFVVQAIAFSNDGKLLAGANWKGDITLWSVGAWKSPRVMLRGQKDPKTLGFSPDSSLLAIATEHSVVVYDLRSGKYELLVKSQKPFDVVSAAFRGKSLLIFRGDKIQKWDIEAKKLTNFLEETASSFFGTISSDGDYLVAGGGGWMGEKKVEIWNLKNRERLRDLTNFKGGLYATALSKNDKLVAFSGGGYGSGGYLTLWDISTMRELGYVSYGDMPMQAIAFGPNDSVVAVGSDNGKVLLYDPAKIRGPEIAKQSHQLCGEILKEKNKTYIVPLSKVPQPMHLDFSWAWKEEILNDGVLDELSGIPAVLDDWSLVTSSTGSKIKIDQFRKLRKEGSEDSNDYIIFGEVHNPGWDEGTLIKIYSNGDFVAASNGSGTCRAFGSLDVLKTDFKTVKERLINEGLLTIAREPLTLGADHYGTVFIEIVSDGKPELRTNADDIRKLMANGGKSAKREAFNQLYLREKPFVESLIRVGNSR